MRSGVRACRCFAVGSTVLKKLEMNALAAFVTRGARPGLSPVPRARAPPRATCDEPSVDGSGLLFNAIFCARLSILFRYSSGAAVPPPTTARR